MEADTVDTLVEEGKFGHDAALAIAKAIDMGIKDANLVTAPLLNERFAEQNARIDVRFAEFRAEFKCDLKELEVRVVRWVFLTMLGNVALSMAGRAAMDWLKR